VINGIWGLAFGLGLMSVVLVGAGFVGTSAIALAMTLVIGLVYVLGALELLRFRGTTRGLSAALSGIPQPLSGTDDWLGTVPAPLRNTVRMRIEGMRVALPGPALTPYLVGLLVMLGMLGTFLGMVLTFKGAVFALDGSTDLQAIRAALSAPIKGLGLAFGTSVAGVATSAMLGLLSAISRRERSEVARMLDRHLLAEFRPFSHRYQQQQTFAAIQAQAQALPAVAQRLQALLESLERRSEQLGDHLQAQQAEFHDEARKVHIALADSVAASLSDSLAAGARAAGESLTPVVAQAMQALAQESRQLHARASEAAQVQLHGLSVQFSATATTVADTWSASLERQARAGQALVSGLDQALGGFAGRFEAHATSLLGGVQASLAATQAAQTEADAARQQALTQSLSAMAATLQGEWQRMGALAVDRQQATVAALEHAAQALVDRTQQLAERMAQMGERDRRALEERTRLVERIDALLQTLQQTAGAQRDAVDTLVAAANSTLERAGAQFRGSLETQCAQAEKVAAQAGASSVELSSLGESFGHGVQLFSASNERLLEALQRVEAAVAQSMARSDEQLAYYVAQAREVIDLSIASQRGIVEDLCRRDSRMAMQPVGSP